MPGFFTGIIGWWGLFIDTGWIRNDEAVTHAGLGYEVGGSPLRRFELAVDMSHVDAQVVGGVDELRPPHLAEQDGSQACK